MVKNNVYQLREKNVDRQIRICQSVMNVPNQELIRSPRQNLFPLVSFICLIDNYHLRRIDALITARPV